ncbi:DUF1800 domain-containing protein [Streptomyces boninensis]|uniref:DUF1800 domain-containing protein n=1 Tax=Streptomyces boninensis TaxID=2039455 RepID=UPI003B2174E1
MAVLDERARVARLLQRTGFGGRGDVGGGFGDTVDRILAPGDDADAPKPPDLGPLPMRGKGKKGNKAGKPDDPDEAAKKAYRQAAREQREALTFWWLDRMTATRRPWLEKRTLLWHDHWATSIQKVKSGQAMLAQNETLRRLGGGDFRAMARAMVQDPALMLWLDAAGNTAEAPNENLARELMELFVLGVGHYEETDVRQAAAALTGWSVDRKGGEEWRARFRPRQHARGAQTVLGTKTDFTAPALVDHLVEQPACPKHVASRLWARLVSSEDKPSEEALERIAASRDLTRMVRAILMEPAFSDSGSVLVKQPVEYVVGSLRALGVRPSQLEKKQRRQLMRTLNGLGQVPFAPPNVGGWPHGAAWLTTAAAKVRIGFAQQLVRQADLGPIERTARGERPEALAQLLGVPRWSEATARVLADAAREPRRVTAIALVAPEHLVLP